MSLSAVSDYPGFIAIAAGVATITILSAAVATVALGAWAALGTSALNLILPSILGHAPTALVLAGKFTFMGRVFFYGGLAAAGLTVGIVAYLIAQLAQANTTSTLEGSAAKQSQRPFKFPFTDETPITPTRTQTTSSGSQPSLQQNTSEDTKQTLAPIIFYQKGTEPTQAKIQFHDTSLTLSAFRKEIAFPYDIPDTEIADRIGFKDSNEKFLDSNSYSLQIKDVFIFSIVVSLPDPK